MSPIRQQLSRVVELMVDHSDQVEVVESNEADRTVFTIKVASSDLGTVIGKQGRTVRALRSLVSSRGERCNERFDLDVAED